MTMSWYRKSGFNQGHLNKCPKHNTWFCWKADAFPETLKVDKTPMRICPVCVQLAKLKIKALKEMFQRTMPKKRAERPEFHI